MFSDYVTDIELEKLLRKNQEEVANLKRRNALLEAALSDQQEENEWLWKEFDYSERLLKQVDRIAKLGLIAHAHLERGRVSRAMRVLEMAVPLIPWD